MVSPEMRRMIRTEKGRLGLVPSEAQPGGSVELIAGSGAPFILRRTGNTRYKLVGDSYINSVMDGDTWDEVEAAAMWLG